MHPILMFKYKSVSHYRLLHFFLFSFVCLISIGMDPFCLFRKEHFEKEIWINIICIDVKHTIPFLCTKLFELVMFKSRWMEFVNLIFVFLFDFSTCPTHSSIHIDHILSTWLIFYTLKLTPKYEWTTATLNFTWYKNYRFFFYFILFPDVSWMNGMFDTIFYSWVKRRNGS